MASFFLVEQEMPGREGMVVYALFVQREEDIMTCPRCGNEWDVSKSPCSGCGLLVRLPNNFRSTTRDSSPRQNQQGSSTIRSVSGNFPIVQPPDDMRPSVEASASSFQPQEPFQPGVFPDISSANLPSEWQHTGSMSILGRPPVQGPAVTPLPETRGNFAARTPQNRTSGPLNSESLSPLPVAHGNELPGQKNVPPRPQTSLPSNSTADVAGLRAKRLVGNTEKGEMRARPAMRPISGDGMFGSSSVLNEHSTENQIQPLRSGILLRNNRYQLRELLNRQEWQTNVYEATWLAQDAQRGGAQVIITELVVPESSSMGIQSILRAATMALTSVGRHAHVPTLWDAFSDQERNFFVFEPVEGESLAAHMRRTGRALSEQEVIDYCTQMADILDFLAQQVPSMVHGLIRPEHIVMSSATNHYALTNFSVILAGGGTQFVSSIDRARLSPYMSPEFARGMVDTRSDLYSLLATAYHTATGSIPTIVGPLGTVTSAQRLNPNLSSQLDQILSKGLRPIAVQRYQRASELRSDLFAMYSVNGSSLVEKSAPVANAQSFSQAVQAQASFQMDAVAQVLPNLLATGLSDDQGPKLLLPRPEDLPPIVERNDTQLSILWLMGILICLTLIVVLSRTLS